MKKRSTTDLRNAAFDALFQLFEEASNGDRVAMEAIRDAGCYCADTLRISITAERESALREVAVNVAKRSMTWPCNLPAMEEARNHFLKETWPSFVGSEVIDQKQKAGRGKKRDASEGTRTRMAHDILAIFNAIRATNGIRTIEGPEWLEQASLLPDLDAGSVSEWVSVARLFVRAELRGKGLLFTAPQKMLNAIQARQTEAGVSTQQAFDYVVGRWLDDGFASVIAGGER